MTVHASSERLSLYLDGALPPAERRRVEDHVEGCPRCRHRLNGLRRVVDGLALLPAAAAPEELAARVGREIDLRGRRRAWTERFALRLPSPFAGVPLHLVALVLALAAIVYLFALGLEQDRRRQTRIVLPAAAPPSAGVGAGDGGPAKPSILRPDRIHLLGGAFRKVDGLWVESGLEERAPDERIALAAPPPADVEIARLAELGALRLRVGERVVEIAFDGGTPDSG